MELEPSLHSETSDAESTSADTMHMSDISHSHHDDSGNEGNGSPYTQQNPALSSMHHTPPIPLSAPSEMTPTRRNKIIQRYKVVKRNQIKNSELYHFNSHLTAPACDDSSLMLPPHAPQNLYARRGSLPPMKSGEGGNAVALLAERLQYTSDAGASLVPSYAAIKRALLSDKFKHSQNPVSRLVAPKALLTLLQSKQLSESQDQKPNLTHRRNSDPGSYLQHRDKERRRQLFVDENRNWASTYGPVIERKIQGWRQRRHQRLQKEYLRLYRYQELAASHKNGTLRLLSSTLSAMPGATHSVNPSSTSAMTLPPTTLPQAYLAAASNLSSTPFMFQPTFLPSTTLAPAPMLLPTSFISPYTFMNSYTVPTSVGAHSTGAYFLPQQQKIVFLPTTTTTGSLDSSKLQVSSTATESTPQFKGLLAPTPVSQSKLRSEASNPEPASRKRKSSLPEKLSSLLQPVKEDPDSPSRKRFCPSIEPVSALKPVLTLPPSTSPAFNQYYPQVSTTLPSSTTSPYNLNHTSTSPVSHHTHLHKTPSPISHHPHSHNSPSPISSYHPNTRTTPPPVTHTLKSPSPLEQCLLQPPLSPQCDKKVPDDRGSPCSLSSTSVSSPIENTGKSFAVACAQSLPVKKRATFFFNYY